MTPESEAAHDDLGPFAKRPRLLELLTDANEIRDLLESYGYDSAVSLKTAKATLHRLLAAVGEEAILRACFMFAGDFARMASELIELFSNFGVTGQVQLNTSTLNIPPSGLDSGWAISGMGLSPEEVETHVQSIGAEIENAASRLSSESLVSQTTDEEITGFGRQLRADPYSNPVWRSLSGSTRRVRHDTASENDLRLLRAATGDPVINDPVLRASPVINVAVDKWQHRCGALVHALEATELTSEDVSPLLVSVIADVQMLTSQARRLLEEAALASRVEGGFRQFLRTDFWFQRWRVYELWTLARLLGVLRHVGGEVHLLRSEGGVWNLRYGRDASPVACAKFPNGNLDILYQYFEKVNDSADMPDIAQRDEQGNYLAIIDPKHGRSYQRTNVDEVARRYNQHFQAGLTAVLNYYAIRSYPFVEYEFERRRTLLISGAGPGSASLKRLELRLEDLLLSRNLIGRTVLAVGPVPKLTSGPPRAGVLLYVAAKAREVDEPSGAWMLSEHRGPLPVSDAKQFIPNNTELLDSSPDGDACIVAAGGEWSLLRSRRQPKRIALLSGKTTGDDMLMPAWNAQGTHFAVCIAARLCIIDMSGGATECVLAREDERVVTMGWTSSGESILVRFNRGGENIFRRLHIPDLLVVDYPPAPELASLGIGVPGDGGVYALGGANGTLIRTRYSTCLHLSGDERCLGKAEGSDPVIGVSPSGGYRVSEGPPSLHREDGVRLLKVSSSDPQVEFPLLRFTASVVSRLRWSLDESRFAFLTRQPQDNRHWSPPEYRLVYARPGDRYSTPVSLPEQLHSDKACFTWLSPSLMHQLGGQKDGR